MKLRLLNSTHSALAYVRYGLHYHVHGVLWHGDA